MRYISLILAGMYVVFALLQLNDPDPLLWAMIYLLATCVHTVAYLRPAKIYWALPVLLAYLAGGIYFFPERFEGFAGKMESKPWVEEARESVGLLICFATISYEMIRQFIVSKRANR